MRETTKLSARIGSVPIPVVGSGAVGIEDPATESPDALLTPALEEIRRVEPPSRPELIDPRLAYRICRTELREGCYQLSFVPRGASLLATRYRGTLRVERREVGYRISGDLYRYRLFDDLVLREPGRLLEVQPFIGRRFRELEGLIDELRPIRPRRPVGIPIYRREDYFSYLEGTSAWLFSIGLKREPCRFTLQFDEYEYDHPATGFSGSFSSSPDRSLRFVLRGTGTADRYEGTAYEGATDIGTVTIDHVSDHVREATLVVHTLEGSVAPAAVDGEDFASVMASANWGLRVVDGGAVSMPDTVSGQDPDECWSESNLHRLMESVPGYDPDDLDHVWRSHLLAVQAELGCGRGIVFDHPGGDLNTVAREGSATFSDDGYPASNSANFGVAEGELQRNVPRAFLRSAAHEVGHAFNQIHQSFEGGNDNSIMTVTPSVADVIAGDGGTFPDAIELTFNDTVRRHLMHLPDPAVRPGAIDFFGSAVNAPEPADISTMQGVAVEVEPSSDQVRLGEPLQVSWRLTNVGSMAVPVPEDLDPRGLISRISVEDPDGHVTFLRPPDQHTCARTGLRALAPSESLTDEAVVFYGRDGFLFARPGKHTVTVVVLWEIAGEHVLAQGSADVWVAYPISQQDNEVAALLLDPEVGLTIATRGAVRSERSRQRIEAATRASSSHPAVAALERMGLAS